MPIDPIGAGVGIAGLLAAFKGAIDGYLLIEGLFDDDDGSRDIALSYHVEKCVLENWGDLHNVNANPPEKCHFYSFGGKTVEIIANILARISVLHGEADRYLERHLSGEAVVTGLSKQQGFHQALVQPGSNEVTNLARRQLTRNRRARIVWSIKNKSKFSDLVERLRQYNLDLVRILPRNDEETLDRTLPSYVLAGLNHTEAIEKLRRLEGERILVKHAASLKLMQQNPAGIRDEPLLHEDDFQRKPIFGQAMSRTTNLYQFKKVWIEWRALQTLPSDSDGERTLLRKRMRALSALLKSITNDALRVPKHVGLVVHDEIIGKSSETFLGLAYAVPDGYKTESPQTLLQILARNAEPALGDKFKLAAALATTLATFHGSDWIHKSFRSDNVLFFHGAADREHLYPSISDPFITGFDASRPDQSTSIDLRPTGLQPLDYYYHPDVRTGASKLFDWYSFGVILLEIAYWKPLSVFLEEEVPAEKRKDLTAIRELCLSSVENLRVMTGAIFFEVTSLCLKCDMPGGDELEMARVIATEIVQKLTQLRA